MNHYNLNQISGRAIHRNEIEKSHVQKNLSINFQTFTRTSHYLSLPSIISIIRRSNKSRSISEIPANVRKRWAIWKKKKAGEKKKTVNKKGKKCRNSCSSRARRRTRGRGLDGASICSFILRRQLTSTDRWWITMREFARRMCVYAPVLASSLSFLLTFAYAFAVLPPSFSWSTCGYGPRTGLFARPRHPVSIYIWRETSRVVIGVASFCCAITKSEATANLSVQSHANSTT